MGRPSKFSQAIADTICKRIAEGESLRAICSDNDMPGKSTVMEWLREKKGFADQYAHAREEQADFYAAQIVDIADEADVETKYDGEDVKLVLDATAVARNRLRVDARKWYASKLAPKKYGDKLAVGGDEDLGPLVVKINKLAS